LPTVTSRHNPLVTRFRASARGDSPNLMLVDGVHLVREAAQAGCRIRDAAVSVSALETIPELRVLVEDLRARRVAVTLVSASVIQALSPVRSSSPIVAIADRPTEDADRMFTRGASPLVLVAVDVQDPGNVGAIVRVAEAAGAAGVVAAGGSADPFGWKALRGSMGSAFRLPLLVRRAAEGAVDEARRRGCTVVATTPRNGRSLYELAVHGPCAVLIGGEGRGLPDKLIDAADERVSVPMQTPVESLNAAVTAALVAYEFSRKRGRESFSSATR
jgi:TrmH family RNA methyltransferase